jgi:hypothetical protein
VEETYYSGIVMTFKKLEEPLITFDIFEPDNLQEKLFGEDGFIERDKFVYLLKNEYLNWFLPNGLNAWRVVKLYAQALWARYCMLAIEHNIVPERFALRRIRG